MAKHREKTERVVVDGIEGDKVRLEQGIGETKDVEISALPEDAKEGDVLREVDGRLEVDQTETARIREEAQGRLNALNSTISKEVDL